MLPALFVGILTDMNVITVWHVGIAAFFLGTVNAFDIPARQAFLAEVVSKGDITNAIALNSAAFNGARIIGPAIAGFVISSIGIPACFYLNAVSFVAVIFALWKISYRGTVTAYHSGIITDIVDGWNFVVKTKSVLYIMSLISVFSLFGIPYITLLPVLADETLNMGVKGFSLLIASAGAGSFLAAMMIAFKGDVKHKGFYISFSGFVFSMAILGISFSENFYLSMILIFFAGWGIVSFLATGNSFIQHTVPDSLRGRVMSFYALVFLGFMPLGNALIGLAADFWGVIVSLKIFAIVCILGSIIFLKFFRRSH